MVYIIDLDDKAEYRIVSLAKGDPLSHLNERGSPFIFHDS